MIMIDWNKIDPKEFQRGRIAAQLAEDCPTDCSYSFWVGYLTEVHYPNGGLVPQKRKENDYERI